MKTIKEHIAELTNALQERFSHEATVEELAKDWQAVADGSAELLCKAVTCLIFLAKDKEEWPIHSDDLNSVAIEMRMLTSQLVQDISTKHGRPVLIGSPD